MQPPDLSGRAESQLRGVGEPAANRAMRNRGSPVAALELRCRWGVRGCGWKPPFRVNRVYRVALVVQIRRAVAPELLCFPLPEPGSARMRRCDSNSVLKRKHFDRKFSSSLDLSNAVRGASEMPATSSALLTRYVKGHSPTGTLVASLSGNLRAPRGKCRRISAGFDQSMETMNFESEP